MDLGPPALLAGLLAPLPFQAQPTLVVRSSGPQALTVNDAPVLNEAVRQHSVSPFRIDEQTSNYREGVGLHRHGLGGESHHASCRALMNDNMPHEFAVLLCYQCSQRHAARDEVLRRAAPMGWPSVDHTDGISQPDERRYVALQSDTDPHGATVAPPADRPGVNRWSGGGPLGLDSRWQSRSRCENKARASPMAAPVRGAGYLSGADAVTGRSEVVGPWPLLPSWTLGSYTFVSQQASTPPGLPRPRLLKWSRPEPSLSGMLAT